MPYRPDREARELAWRNAEQNGARASRPLVTDPLEARRRRLAQIDPLGLDGDDPPPAPWIDPWIDRGVWVRATTGPLCSEPANSPPLHVIVNVVFDYTKLAEELSRAVITAERLRVSLGYPPLPPASP